MDSEMTSQYDAIVVGGGHNGLVATCYLAKAGYRTLLLEQGNELGGATKSVYAFAGVDARLSRYSYLVALLPDQIKTDLGLNFETLSRSISSYTPWQDSGILINRNYDKISRASIDALTGNQNESANWERFYSRVAQFAAQVAPTLLRPVPSAVEIRELVGAELWNEFVTTPFEETLAKYFTNDVVKGIVLTDALIGTFTSAREALANICFLYHLIGNGTGEWRVPKGGMGALVEELADRAISFGAELKSGSKVISIREYEDRVIVESESGERYFTSTVLATCAPKTLERLAGIAAPPLRDGSQMKMNMVLARLPQFRSGIDPRVAMAGTLHINESFTQLERAYRESSAGMIPTEIPCELYCHTLTDPSILAPSLSATGMHTLTLFAIHTPASLFDGDHDGVKEVVTKRILDGLNSYLIEPIESCLAKDQNGRPCLEVKTPQELEAEIDLPRGNIFHANLTFPWREPGDNRRWGVETTSDRIFLAGAGSLRGGGVSGIGGHNGAMAAMERLANSK